MSLCGRRRSHPGLWSEETIVHDQVTSRAKIRRQLGTSSRIHTAQQTLLIDFRWMRDGLRTRIVSNSSELTDKSPVPMIWLHPSLTFSILRIRASCDAGAPM